MGKMSFDCHYSSDLGNLGRVIETQTLWVETVCRVWLPGKGTLVRLPAARLRPVQDASVSTMDGIFYLFHRESEDFHRTFSLENPKLFMWYDQAVVRTMKNT